VIRTNLSTRPFYNDRAVHLVLIALALVVAGATAFNVSRVIRYSRSDTQLATQATRDEARAAALRQEARRLRTSIDPRLIDFASADARQANELIDRRTFSWTELFNRLETTLPDEVHITAVKPNIDPNRGIVLTINVVSKSVDDMNTFMENLEATGAFGTVRTAEEHFDEQGLLQSLLEAPYEPAVGKPAPGKPAAARPATGRPVTGSPAPRSGGVRR
jgi:Tfp pilus assembly protein PilN